MPLTCTHRNSTFTVFLILCFLFCVPELADAALLPQEIAVLVNTKSPDSVHIGKLYLELRNVPQEHLIEVAVNFGEEISRAKYDELIALPVKGSIEKLNAKGIKIRCIVTTYGIPLRIMAQMPSDSSEKEIEKYEEISKQKRQERKQLKENKEMNPGNKKIKELNAEIDKIQFQLGHLRGIDTIAAVDSELALVLYAPYPLAGWQPNPGFILNRGRMQNNSGRLLMISRIDAPSVKLTENLIRTAIEVEQTGLTGNFYLDARGLTGKDAYSIFDGDIRKTAQMLKKGFIPVVLDNKSELFAPGAALSAALYCGWYSLGKYIDAFEWSRGAVGYHVASAEAVSLHNPKSTIWVKSMLERGVIATLGPVSEPYLTTFPLPSLFFQLFMSGQYTLAEVFTMTNPFLSWQMMLIGDPLYNPFKVKPAYPLKDAPAPPM